MGWRKLRIVGTVGLALVAGLVPAPRSDVRAAPPGGPYHFVTPTRVLDTRATGKLAASGYVNLSDWANHYVNITVTDSGADVALHFSPCDAPSAPRSILLAEDSASLFFMGTSTCMRNEVATHVIIDVVAVEGAVDDAGFRYVKVPGSPALAGWGGDQPLGPGVYPLDVTAAVPAAAGGIAFEVGAAQSSETPSLGYATIAPCGTVPALPQVTMGTPSGDFNIAHVARPPGTPLCLHLEATGSVHVFVAVLGYFSNGLVDGGDVAPAFQSELRTRPGLVPRDPERVLDTRLGLGAPAAGKVGAGETLRLDLGSVVTADTGALSLNVTATEPEADGYLTAYPCAEGRPDTSNLNYRAGATVPNMVIVRPDADGDVCIFTDARSHLLADLTGTYDWDAGLPYGDEGPRRILDTRTGYGAVGPVAAGSVTPLMIRSKFASALPAAATVNITVVDAQGWGYVTAYPCDQPRPETSSVNYVAGQTVAGLTTVRLSADNASLCLYSYAGAHLLVDIAGSYNVAAQMRLQLLPPSRRLDTRVELSGEPNTETVWEIDAAGSDPPGAVRGVVANLTATGAVEAGYLTGFNCGTELPNASNLNYSPGADVANLAFVTVAPLGFFSPGMCVYNSGTTHVLVDLFARISTVKQQWVTSIRGLD